jgi:hypothetical protein
MFLLSSSRKILEHYRLDFCSLTCNTNVLYNLLIVIRFKSLNVHHYIFRPMWSSTGVKIIG